MDSRSGPELSNKVHGFEETVKLWDRIPALRTLFATLALCAVAACGGDSDPRTVEGTLAKASAALAQKDAKALFRVVDQRARHALASTVTSRREAAEIIRRSYPKEQQEAALARLGDAAQAKDAAELFAMRCASACLEELAGQVAAPEAQRVEGPETVVKTVRGKELRLYKGSDTWYGLVWNTQALSRERDRAAAELDLVRQNAETFAKQGALK